jgi:PPOX class probable F420-dependent enzyme
MAYTVNLTGGPRRLSDLPFRAIGDQPGFAPGDLEAFVGARRVAVLAYSGRDGRPNQSPIWYVYRQGTFFLSTVTGSPKHRALERDPRVCLTIQDEAAPYRAVIIDGDVTLSAMPTDDPTAGMAVRYLGRLGAAEYDKLTAETYERTGLTLLTLQPEAVRGFDNASALGRATRAFVKVRNHLPIPRTWL